MADLPTIANRMNDVEIGSSQPVTESLMRKKGSNINYLLDFLGITDGSTSPSGGNLSDFVSALTLIAGHTMDLQVNVPGGTAQTLSVGTFPKNNFVDTVLYIKHTSNLDLAINLHSVGVTGGHVSFNGVFDGGSSFAFNEVPTYFSPTITGGAAAVAVNGNHDIVYDSTNAATGTRAVNAGDYGDVAIIQVNPVLEALVLDSRDFTTDVAVTITTGIDAPPMQIYRGYRLNISSGTIF